jgi:hypothetical protein
MAKENTTRTIDCACVIHSDVYDWKYVDILYNMIQRQLGLPFRFHVYTEAERAVPSHMIKHELTAWSGISGYRKSWWYKLQLFNPEHVSSDLLFFDLDLVLVRPISWIVDLDADYFWSVRDFRYLQGNRNPSVNSSIMWFNVPKFAYVWEQVKNSDVQQLSRRFHGDQDYINVTIDKKLQQFFPESNIQSYRWECLDGGYDFQKRQHRQPGTGAAVSDSTSVMVFHGQPKPHQVRDPLIQRFWI